MSFAYGSRTYGGGANQSDQPPGRAVSAGLGSLIFEVPGKVTILGGKKVVAPRLGQLILSSFNPIVGPGEIHDIAPSIVGVADINVVDFQFTRNITPTIIGESTNDLSSYKTPNFVVERADPWYNNEVRVNTAGDADTSERSGRNSPWIYRRNVQITAPPTGLHKGHPIEMVISRDVLKQNKMRDDKEDIVVAYLVSNVPEEWHVVSHDVVDVAINPYFTVRFPLATEMDADEVSTNKYYVYYGNKDLLFQPRVRPYSHDDYPVSVAPDSSGVSYTGGEEDWDTEVGASDVNNAKASFKFWGSQIKIFSDVYQDYGIMSVQIDEGSWVDVDLFSFEEVLNTEVYNVTGLEAGPHIIRMRVSGHKNPSSVSHRINFTQLTYKKHNTGVNVREEVNRKLGWNSVLGGVV